MRHVLGENPQMRHCLAGARRLVASVLVVEIF
jgi:hypothetical protein